MKTTLDVALIRWSVRCRSWQELAAGHQPDLGAFLAGWFSRDAGIPLTVADRITMRDSFRCGWQECDDMIAIQEQQQAALKYPSNNEPTPTQP